MKLKGISVKLNKNLGFRKSNPEKDKDLNGNPIMQNDISFVQIKDCKLYEKNERTYYDATEAPCIPVDHGGTYYGYGKTVKRKSEKGIYIDNELCYEYNQTTVYFAYKCQVYTGSIRNKIN